MNPYGDTIQEHFRHPRNYGSLDAPDIRHEDVNPFCGDRVRIELSIGADDKVSAARFQGDLCVIAKAASSLLTEMITGLTLDSIHDVSERNLLDALHAEIQPARRKCALLPLEVLQSGVDAYRRRTS
ncbi:MAG TPA: iron-sulfur cluster assembly scaffold protein [Thermoanaerobaculia bacterium]|jgi:nitrogen fixation NifU-like protein